MLRPGGTAQVRTCDGLGTVLTSPGVERVGTVKFSFDDVNLKKLAKVKRGNFGSRKTYHSLDFELQVGLSSRSGVLQFNVCYGGEKCGTAEIEFEKEKDSDASSSNWTGRFSDLSVDSCD